METLAEVVERLDDIVLASKRGLARRGYFAAMYRAMTARIDAGLDAGRFQDPERLVRLDVRFARYYFDALENPSKPWRVALEVEDHARVGILQHLLLGMNAHINFDLGQAVAEVGGELDATLKHDYDVINDILGELSDDVQNVLGEHSPGLRSLDEKLGRFDEGLFNWSARKAREGAWNNASLIRMAGPAVLPLMEHHTAFLGRLILAVRADGRLGETDYQDPERIPEVIDALVAL